MMGSMSVASRPAPAKPPRLRRIAISAMTTALIAIGLPACGDSPNDTRRAGVLTIGVSIAPQAYVLERLAGHHATPLVMVGSGANPATYEPKPGQLRDLAEADAYLSIGVPFENAWLARFSATNPDMLMVDTTRGIDRLSDGDGQTDPHIWLSPRLVAIQAGTIHDALVRLDPEHRSDYDANLTAFRADVAALDTRIGSALRGLVGRAFIVFHPAWAYFARDYGLEMVPVEVGGTEPGPAELAHVVDTARRRGIRIVLAQPEFSPAQATAIAADIGGRVLLISPLDRDWSANLEKVAETLAAAVGTS
jgi:zinc transport system substrate-binding protein